MKKMKWILLLTLCVALLMSGCASASSQNAAVEEPADTTAAEPAATEPADTSEAKPADAEEPAATETAEEPEADASAATADGSSESTADSTDGRVIYAEQIARYAKALSEQWDMETYYENDMCEMVEAYYEGDPMENVGVAFPDLDADGKPELVIGAIYNSDNDPAVFEVWTTVNGTPVMLAQSHSRARYYLDYDEAGVWFFSYEASNSAYSSGCYYYTLSGGALSLMQAIIYDGSVDPAAPWYMADDEDWDISNDDPIDEATYNAIWEAHAKKYEVFDYTPYSKLGDR